MEIGDEIKPVYNIPATKRSKYVKQQSSTRPLLGEAQAADPEVMPSSYNNFVRNFRESEQQQEKQSSQSSGWFDLIRGYREFLLIGGIIGYVLLK